MPLVKDGYIAYSRTMHRQSGVPFTLSSKQFQVSQGFFIPYENGLIDIESVLRGIVPKGIRVGRVGMLITPENQLHEIRITGRKVVRDRYTIGDDLVFIREDSLRLEEITASVIALRPKMSALDTVTLASSMDTQYPKEYITVKLSDIVADLKLRTTDGTQISWDDTTRED